MKQTREPVPARCPGPSPFGASRRELLRFGMAGMAGMGLPGLLGLRSTAAAVPSDTSVILVWCHGGPSHLETYDPKPDAAAEYRGPYGAIPTTVDGLRYSELMPLQAKLAHKTTLIRGVVHRGICHQQGLQTLLTGHEMLVLHNKAQYPDMMCVAGHLRQQRASASTAVLPANVGIPPLPYGGAAYLGPGAEPFVVGGDPNLPSFEVPNLKLGVQPGRLDRRMSLMQRLDGLRRDLDADTDVAARGKQYHDAVDMLTSGKALQAFDLTREDPKTRDRYGRTRWGQSLLMSRRLVEAGVSAVTASLIAIEGSMAGSWDDHAVNCDVFKAMKERGPIFDRGVSALIEDLYDRGLDKKVLVIVTGEFGRTPKISYAEGRPGRDHWPYAMSILLAGGGFKMGQVLGATDSRGEYVTEGLMSPNDLVATVYHHLGIDPTQEFIDRSGRPIRILDRAGPIPELA